MEKKGTFNFDIAWSKDKWEVDVSKEPTLF